MGGRWWGGVESLARCAPCVSPHAIRAERGMAAGVENGGICWGLARVVMFTAAPVANSGDWRLRPLLYILIITETLASDLGRKMDTVGTRYKQLIDGRLFTSVLWFLWLLGASTPLLKFGTAP